MPRASRARCLTVAIVLAAAAPLTACGSGTRVNPAPAAQEAQDPGMGPGGTVQGGKRIVLLDPGHNGGNAGAPAQINKQVPDGRGGTKACNTVGASTNATADYDAVPEHKFAWSLAQDIKVVLEGRGVIVEMTRTNDTGVGPCVDVRGKMAEQLNADAVVSLHADGAPPSGHGFHVAYSAPPLSQSQGEPSVSLATAIRDAMRGTGLLPSTYAGKNGLAPRSDLAGLNLSRRPAALVECANMRNPDEAVMLGSPVGRARIANAIAAGVMNWLASH
ncbi:MAG TPA: N-acetylmuramoyl-L-alanine amidase [Pseudonocardia sp.]|nr:N-acetylmuramoyl-L-alanine amidase [Pseudonocardia sp.]